MTILVLAATGKTGRRLVPRLRSRGVEVRAASRSAETRFDWTDRTSWADAIRGVEAVYLVAPEEPDLVEPFVAQAVAAGVRRFVVLSGRGLDHAAGRFAGMAAAEQAVRASGVDWVVLRANNFSQNFDEDMWRPPLLAGRLALPIGDVGEPFVDVADVADVAAELLTTDGHAGRTYELSGPDSLTFAQVVEQISAASGRSIEYVELTPAQYAEGLRAEGYPEDAVADLDAMFALMRAGHNTAPTDAVEQVLGRPATSFETYVRDAWGAVSRVV